MLSHAHNWLISKDSNSAVVLGAACLGSYKVLRNLIYHGPCAPFPLTMTRKAVVKAWLVANSLRPVPPDIFHHIILFGLI